MTVTTTVNKVTHSANGVTTAWPFAFVIQTVADVEVIVLNGAGAESTVPSSSYSITGLGNAAGGTVTYPTSGSPLEAGNKLTIRRKLAIRQATDLVTGAAFYAEDHEVVFDRHTMVDQQQQEELDRSLKIPLSDGALAVTLPTAANRAGKAVKFDADGNVTVSAYDPDAQIDIAAAQATIATTQAGFAQAARVTAETAADSAVSSAAAASAAAASVTGLLNNGWPDRTQADVSINEATRTVTVAPVAGSFTIVSGHTTRTYTGPVSVQIGDVSGLWYVKFDASGTLVASQVSWLDDFEACLVTAIQWSTTDQRAVVLALEQHGTVMDRATHYHLHRSVGTVLGAGLGIANAVTNGNGSADTHAKIGLSDGYIEDEDLRWYIAHADPVTAAFQQPLYPYARAPVMYLSGVNEWRYADTVGALQEYLFPRVGGVPQVNVDTGGGVYGLSPVASSRYFASWVVATNDPRHPIMVIAGQRQDTSAEDAASNNPLSGLYLDGLPFPEYRFLYRLIWYYANGLGNTPSVALRSVTDVRGAIATTYTAAASSPHNVLSGRADAGAHPSSAITHAGQALDAYLAGVANPPKMHVREEAASGVNGGNTIAGGWFARRLNTVVLNTIPGAYSVNVDTVYLPAGTYDVQWRAPFGFCHRYKTQLWSGSTVLAEGSSMISPQAPDNMNYEVDSVGYGRIVMPSGATINLMYRSAQASNTGNGLGFASGFGTEIYAELIVTKVA